MVATRAIGSLKARLARVLLSLGLATVALGAFAQCFRAAVTAPAPLLGNHDEVVRLDDGTVWKVVNTYEYLYEYYPQVTMCPSTGKMLVGRVALDVVPLSARSKDNSRTTRRTVPSENTVVIHKKSNCGDYFIAESRTGFHVLEWYGGYDPDEGDEIAGDISGYGFKDLIYLRPSGRDGRVYVDDYGLSKSSAIEKYLEHCD